VARKFGNFRLWQTWTAIARNAFMEGGLAAMSIPRMDGDFGVHMGPRMLGRTKGTGGRTGRKMGWSTEGTALVQGPADHAREACSPAGRREGTTAVNFVSNRG
jgi:hypothetical protein